MLYKYLPWERCDIFQTGLMRFTQPGDFNDPFELHPSFDLMSRADVAALPPAPPLPGESESRARLLTPEVLDRLNQTLSAGLQRQAAKHAGQPGQFLLDPGRIAQSTLDAKYGILCLTEVPDSLLMWAHYAQNHRGLVLQFDQSHPFFSSTPSDSAAARFGRVEYTPDRPVLSFSSIESPIVFFRKSPEWQYEREWRLIRHLSDASKVLDHPEFPRCLFTVPWDAITGVIVGLAVPHTERIALVHSLQQPHLRHIKVFQTSLHRDSYKLEVVPPLDGVIPEDALRGRIFEAR